jgi:hypothetical protein
LFDCKDAVFFVLEFALVARQPLVGHEYDKPGEPASRVLGEFFEEFLHLSPLILENFKDMESRAFCDETCGDIQLVNSRVNCCQLISRNPWHISELRSDRA